MSALSVTAASKQAPKRLPIRDAATVMLIDASGREPKVLMGRRHEGVRFMPGKYVFPGGRVERADGLVSVAAPYPPHVERRLKHGVRRATASRVKAYGLAAIRELAEETGLMIGQRGVAFRARGDAWAPFVEAGIAPSLDGLHFVARAITPPGRPRRFDTRFFAADASLIAARREGVIHADAELVELCWPTLAEARSLDLPAITRLILVDLEARLEDGLERDQPTPFYRRGSQSARELV
ncbi:NUDIX hydrolase [Hansschlegelia quercus]|uniref:NUDIX hydrolase n=1 Tax=Hansschlegelia quercus TaxID=2528245 RepID=A0A4Q9GJB5_9HYPH|nr:NUDIX hydrolase [Hansschlegelia quercus]TBN54389.1 NUDIX hydrolase [Hansschlegelia quercus]